MSFRAQIANVGRSAARLREYSADGMYAHPIQETVEVGKTHRIRERIIADTLSADGGLLIFSVSYSTSLSAIADAEFRNMVLCDEKGNVRTLLSHTEVIRQTRVVHEYPDPEDERD